MSEGVSEGCHIFIFFFFVECWSVRIFLGLRMKKNEKRLAQFLSSFFPISNFIIKT